MVVKNKFIKKLSLSLLITTIISFALIYFSIPSNIKLIEGQTKNLFVGIANASIDEESVNVLNISENTVSENIQTDFGTIEINPIQSGTAKIDMSILGVPVKSVSVNVSPEIKLVPVGKAVGVTVDTDGILVLGTGYVNKDTNEVCQPSKGVLKTGDLITHVNGEKITQKEELIEIVESSTGSLNISIVRNGETLQETLTPIISTEDGKQKIGAWVRDCTQGIGTLTYYNPQTKGFGALGHGVYDIDTKSLLSIKDGKITETIISGIKKGEKGIPGELSGETDDTKVIGEIYQNTECGLYGKIYSENVDFTEQEALPIATKENIKEGKAYILTNISGNKVEKYEINIESIDINTSNPSKCMIIRITDEKLLSQTGGIIQGMSGSPIIQDNHIIGAVTHVFVNDPTKGYGIFIENML